MRDLIETFPHQWTKQAIEYDTRIGDDTAPFYEDQVLMDSNRLASLKQHIRCPGTDTASCRSRSRVLL